MAQPVSTLRIRAQPVIVAKAKADMIGRIKVTGFLNRPDARTTHYAGLLRKDQFQVAYVTNDLERACELFSQRYGIGEYDYIRGDMPEGGRIAVALAWSGVTNYEIIEAHGDEAAF